MEIYELEFEVRNYECDLQGIVNNSVYLNYLEHARHTYLKEKGIDFQKLHNEGIDLVVTRIEADYKTPLTGGDKFIVRHTIARDGNLKLVFNQEIIKLPEQKTSVKAKVFGVGIQNGRPIRIDDVPGIKELLAEL